MASIDRLEVQIEAQAKGATQQLDSLVTKLNRVKSSLTGINGSGLQGLANGVAKLSTAMQGMNNVKTTDFTRLAKNIQQLGNINTASINGTASAMAQISSAFSKVESVSAGATSIGTLASNISKLGNKSTTSAITNIPLLGKSLNELMTTLSKAPQVSDKLIKMTNAMANLSAQGSKVGTASKPLSNGIKSYSASADKATTSSKSLASQLGKLYANYFLIIRAFKGLGTAITSSMDYIEQYNFYNVTMGKVSDEWSKDYAKYGYDNAQSYGDSFKGRMTETISKMSGFNMNANGTLTDTKSSNLGLDVTSLTNYSAGIQQVTNSLGLTGEAGTSTAKALTMLSGDMSSFRNISQSSVQTAFTSGLIGQSRALYKYGIDITNATLQQYAYDAGVTKLVKDMTQGEKMQLRTIAILDQSKAAYGDLANTIMSPANQLRLLQNNFAALSRTIGNMFLPVVANVLPYINGLVIAIRRLFDWTSSMLGVDLSSIIGQSSAGYSTALDDLADDADNTSDSIDGVTDSAKKMEGAFLGIDQINTVGSSSDSSGTSSAANSTPIDLTDALSSALSNYQSVWDTAFGSMNNTANGYANNIIGFFEGIAKYAEPSVDSVKNLWNDGLKKFGDFSFKAGEDFLSEFLIPLGKWTLGKGLPQLIDATNQFLDDIDWSMLNKNLSTFWKVIEPFAEGVGQGMVSFFKTLSIVGSTTINLLGGALGIFANGLKALPVSSMNIMGQGLGEIIGAFLLFKTMASIPSVIAAVGVAFNGFMVAISAHPYIAVAAGLIAVISALQKLGSSPDTSKAVSVLTDVNDQFSATITSGVVSAGILKTLSDKYFDLAEKGSLTNDEQKRAQNLASDMVKYYPELEKYYNKTTKLLDINRQGVDDLITSKLNEIKTEAYHDKLVSLYQKQADLVTSVATSQKELTSATDEYNKATSGSRSIIDTALGKYTALAKKVDEAQAKYDGFNNGLKETNITIDTTLGQYLKLIGATENVGGSTQSMGAAVKTTGTNMSTDMTNTVASIGLSVANLSPIMANAGYNANMSFYQNFNPNGVGMMAYDAVNMIRRAFDALDMSAYGAKAGDTFIGSLTQALQGTEIQLGMNANMNTGNVALNLSRIQKKANGGFVGPGQAFIARENGPELVGTMGGHTAVANNNQITTGIANAVAPAVYQAVVSAMGTSKGSNNQPMTVNNTIVWNGKIMASMVTNAQQDSDRIFYSVSKA